MGRDTRAYRCCRALVAAVRSAAWALGCMILDPTVLHCTNADTLSQPAAVGEGRVTLAVMTSWCVHGAPCRLRFSRCRDKQTAFEKAFPIVDAKK